MDAPMFPLLETAVAFAAVMLATSLFVSALVQLLANGGRFRSRTTTDMLRSIIHGFRVFYNDADVVASEGEYETAKSRRWREWDQEFVDYVLAEPALRARGEKTVYAADPRDLPLYVEYIGKDDLCAIIYNAAWTPGQGGLSPSVPRGTIDQLDTAQEIADAAPLPLPENWFGTPKAYATTANFAAYVQRWFETIEGTAAEHFKRQMRLLTLLVSVTVVVLFNLDGFHLIGRLYEGRDARLRLGEQATAIQTTATRLGVPGAPASTGSPNDATDTTTRQLALELQKTSTLLDAADVGIGWQNSWIAKRYCASSEKCNQEAPHPGGWRLVGDSLFWIAGLLFSCVMVSLGAPFWVTTLASVVNLKNAVQARKERDTSGDTAGNPSIAARTRRRPPSGAGAASAAVQAGSIGALERHDA